MTPESAMTEPTSRPGRKRDHTRDADILDATLDVLADEGYDGMTVDMVAARARAGKATVYRRWPSKEELVIDAVACMKGGPGLAQVPDTGTLRGDLVGLIREPSLRDGQRKLRVMTAIASLVARNPDFADAARAAIFQPRIDAYRTILTRAIDRGEIEPDVDVELIAHIVPAMAANRTLFQQRPADRTFMIRIIDHLILPAAGLAPDTCATGA